MKNFILFFLLSNFSIIGKIKLPDYGFESMEPAGKGYFFILHRDKSLIMKIDTNGNIMDTVIKGKGREIGKAKFLADMVYDKKRNTLLVSDLFLRRISEFDRDGKIINSFLVEEIVGDIYICGDTVYIRYLEKVKEIDSLNYEVFLIKKIDRKSGSFIKNIARGIINRKFYPFFSSPFFIDCKQKLIYMIFPPNKIQIRNLNGELLYEIENKKWIFVTDLFLMDDRYLVISSFSEDERNYIPYELIKIWKRISVHKGIFEEITKRNLFEIKKEAPMVYEKVSYIVDIYDLNKKEFVLENLIPPGKLVNAFEGRIFFIRGDTLLITEIKR